jgi:hypothetical protein
LRHLRMGWTKVTDAGVSALCRMTQLETLDLWPTEITDEGALDFRTLVQLKELSVGPHVSEETAKELKKSLPDCRITIPGKTGTSSNY